jgi:hypothetical protein
VKALLEALVAWTKRINADKFGPAPSHSTEAKKENKEKSCN